MRVGDLVVLGDTPRYSADIFSYIAGQVKTKNVLNVGAAGGVKTYLPKNLTAWLHHRLGQVASEVVGIDIDSEGIDYAEHYDVVILNENCETMELGKTFDVIVLSDVLEHLDAPGDALQNLMRHLAPSGKMLVTTPNPTPLGMLYRVCATKRSSVFWDHVSCFYPENIQAMCDRYGYRVTSTIFFDHIDRRTFGTRVKSYFYRLIGTFFPRLSTSFLMVIEHG